MAKLNTKTSIVDYLKSQGKDSSYSARKKLATSMGISNYSGTAEQNTQMLKTLQNQASTPKKTTTSNVKTNTSTKTNTNTKTTEQKTTTPKLNGVDESLTAKASSTYEKPQEVVNADAVAQNDMSSLREVASRQDIISQAQWNALNKQFTVPSAVVEADAYLKSQLEKIQSGKTSYSDQVKDMMSQIQNRDKFSYDVDADPLFQQALASAMNSGKTAMQDTIGQASALTGGYGSTYATTAGNQAYNAFIEDAYNNLPQYYQMAMEAYQAEGDEMYRQLGMLSDADAQEYERMLTAYDATYQNRNQMYNEAYSLFRDSKTDAYNIANLQLSENAQLVNNAFNLYQASSDYANNLYERSYNEWADGVSQATQLAGMQNSDWWNKTNFDEGVRQYEKNFAEEVRQYNNDYAQKEKWNQADLDYKNSALEKEYDYKYAALQQDQNQFDATMTYNMTKDKTAKSGYVVRKDENGNEVTYKEPTAKQKQDALKAYNEGGQKAYDQYVDSLESDVYVEGIAEYVFGGNETKGYGVEPYLTRTYTKTKQTTNWLWGVDNNDKVKDNHGEEYTLKELKAKLEAEGVDDAAIDKILSDLNKKDVGATYTYSSKK